MARPLGTHAARRHRSPAQGLGERFRPHHLGAIVAPPKTTPIEWAACPSSVQGAMGAATRRGQSASRQPGDAACRPRRVWDPAHRVLRDPAAQRWDAAPRSTPQEAARAGPRRKTESMLVLRGEVGVGRATLLEEVAKASRGLGMAVMAIGRASRVEIPFAALSPLMIRRVGRIWVFLPSSRPHLGWASGSTRRDAVATVAGT